MSKQKNQKQQPVRKEGITPKAGKKSHGGGRNQGKTRSLLGEMGLNLKAAQRVQEESPHLSAAQMRAQMDELTAIARKVNASWLNS